MFDAIYDDGIDIMRIKVHCVRMENTSLEYFVSWMILYAWNIRWYYAFDAPVLQYPTLTEYSSDTLHSEYSLAISCLEYFIAYIFFLR